MSIKTLRQSPDHKPTGAYYTPAAVVHRLVSWAISGDGPKSVLDPACGDGRFLRGIPDATGIDIDAAAVKSARLLAPEAEIVHADFFDYAQSATRAFGAVVGNPPFVRFQSFSGASRLAALELCRKVGVKLSGLSSSWAPFVVASSSLLREGGRLAFVVPAEISYAVYARPVLEYLLGNFSRVGLIATRKKLFDNLSEDCWLLLADGFGGQARGISLRLQESLNSEAKDSISRVVSISSLEEERFRLRPFLLSAEGMSAYEHFRKHPGVKQLGELAELGIGYVTGANDFFHLRPSEATSYKIPSRFLRSAVRAGKDLREGHIDAARIADWETNDRPYLLLDLPDVDVDTLPPEVVAYLNSDKGREARTAYKCTMRDPWYKVPDVQVPDAFLSIMSTHGPRLSINYAGATCSNSVHAVTFTVPEAGERVATAWQSPLLQLSAEIEGHALGGGMLKLEPVEARRILVPLDVDLTEAESGLIREALLDLRSWRLNA